MFFANSNKTSNGHYLFTTHVTLNYNRQKKKEVAVGLITEDYMEKVFSNIEEALYDKDAHQYVLCAVTKWLEEYEKSK
jgi:hypothetical protein